MVEAEESQRRKGSSRRTKNIALIVALMKTESSSSAALGDASEQAQGYIVATCHLFWHPQYVYERVRCVCSDKALVLRRVLMDAIDVLAGKGHCCFARSPASRQKTI